MELRKASKVCSRGFESTLTPQEVLNLFISDKDEEAFAKIKKALNFPEEEDESKPFVADTKKQAAFLDGFTTAVGYYLIPSFLTATGQAWSCWQHREQP